MKYPIKIVSHHGGTLWLADATFDPDDDNGDYLSESDVEEIIHHANCYKVLEKQLEHARKSIDAFLNSRPGVDPNYECISFLEETLKLLEP